MHQAGERGQVVDVEIVGLVQHQVTAHQPQHGGNLAATALAFGGGRQVVDGAYQNRRGQQLVHLRVVHHPAQQGVGVVVAFNEVNAAVFIQQRLA